MTKDPQCCGECGDPIEQNVYNGKWQHVHQSLVFQGPRVKWNYLHEAVSS